MPELKSQSGYFITLGVMAVIAVGLLLYFWRLGWIFQKDEEIVVNEHKHPEHDFHDN
jgi:hypothetical protein